MFSDPGAHYPAGQYTLLYDGEGTLQFARGSATVENVPSYRHARGVTVDVEGAGPVAGDVVWGGNWFFLVGGHGQELEPDNVARLTDFTWRIRRASTRLPRR